MAALPLPSQHTMVLGTSPMVLFGTEEQKKQYLPAVASGKGKLGSLALTEPGAGSDLQGGVRTHAEHMEMSG